jgi:uncharacterized damage-inducible protein DinB
VSDLPRTALSRGSVGSLPELAGRYLEEYLDKIRLALAELDEEQVWWRPAPGTNSAANLLLHLCGNLSLWILAGAGGRPYQRHRGGEFAAQGGFTKAELVERLTRVVGDCREVLAALDAGDLGRPLEVQGYETDLLSAVVHGVEHMSYHTGQIVWIAKQLRAGTAPFEFYPRHSGE